MNEPAAIVSARGLHKSYTLPQETIEVIRELTFEQRPGEFLVLVGPSGCGKTTLLRMIAGLLTPDRGEIAHAGRPIQGPVEGVGVVFQDYSRSLFPWLRVGRNVSFGLRGMESDLRAQRVQEALASVALSGFDDYYPWQLSGGMQQRVALARALALKPALLLLDEPFASVDAQTRLDLEEVVLDVWEQLRLSALLVTHDIDEAVFMGDRVLVLSGRPSKIEADIVVDLPRPRDVLETKEHPRFLEIRHEVYELIRRGQRQQSPATRAGA